jgi:hypothetical protein
MCGWIGTALIVIAAGSREARAQDTATVKCAGQRISGITVRSSAPTVAAFRRFPTLTNVVSAIHTTTNVEVIRRFLLLEVGDRCDELRRAESERILRAQPFIADASVRVLPEADGAVELDVRTTDEIALVLGVAAGNSKPVVRLVRIGDGNLAGEGIYVAGDWRAGGAFRDGYGGRFIDNQLLGRPYTLNVQAHKNPLGDDWQSDALHPFLTDIQRIAWRARAGGSDDYVQFMNDENSSHALRVIRHYADIGGIVRLGPPGRLSLFGASLSGDDERPSNDPVLVTNHGFAPDTGTSLRGRYDTHHMARVNALWGVRDIGFARVRGFDALTATQDLAIGFQLGTVFGRTLSVLGSRDDDIFMAGDIYIGAVGRNNALRFQLEGEGRRNNDQGTWDGILTDARAIEYFKATPSNTTTASLEFSGGWRQRVPFNLSFSDPIGGVRGYAASNTPGGQRLVARLEHRLFIGRPYNLGDLGLGVFADAGRLWAGDIPYGVNTPVRSSFGFSILGTAPPSSARLWRIDFAIATSSENGRGRFELRIGNRDKTTFFLPEPSDIQSIREPTVPSSVFRWPQ